MSHAQNTRRFKANPVEITILSIISVVFFHSIYNLVYSHDGFQPSALVPMHANPISEGQRSLASASQNLFTWDIHCEKDFETQGNSNKIRLNGPLCGIDRTLDTGKLIKANIVNTTNQYNATVFTNVGDGKFSTDYIPLVPGKNSIHIEFSFYNGKSFSQDYIVNKDN